MSAADRRVPAWPDGRAQWSLVVVGCGLIGGSVALATRRRWPRATIVGIDAEASLRRVRRTGVVDVVHPSHALLDVLLQQRPKIVVLATDVDTIIELLDPVGAALRTMTTSKRPLVLDVGSVKTPIMAAAAHTRCPGFVGGHPMTGSEKSGAEAARADLFDDRPFVLCSVPRSPKQLVRRARGFVAAIGARPLVLDAELHDRCVAVTSHLPHALAWTLMKTAMDLEQERLPSGLPWSLAAGSWRDATRVAASDPESWRKIFARNRGPLLAAIDDWLAVVAEFRRELARGNPAGGVVDARAIAEKRKKIAAELPMAAKAGLRDPSAIGHACRGFGGEHRRGMRWARSKR